MTADVVDDALDELDDSDREVLDALAAGDDAVASKVPDERLADLLEGYEP